MGVSKKVVSSEPPSGWYSLRPKDWSKSTIESEAESLIVTLSIKLSPKTPQFWLTKRLFV